MTTVVLCGEREDAAVSGALFRALGAYGGVQLFDGRRIAGNGGGPAYFLYDSPQIPKAEGVEGILIFKNTFLLRPDTQSAPTFLPVLEANNLAAAAALRDSGSIAVTCGTSPRDTFSIASLRDDSAVVSLQRELRGIHGEVTEPHDIPVRLRHKTGVYPLLVSCATLLLSGVPSQRGFCF